MKIVIAGAGDVGFHLAKLLSYESQDIFIIDHNTERLNYVNTHLDVIATKGDATSIKILKEIGIDRADIILAVTESQNTNFTIAIIAKKLGARKTIARVSNSEFLKNKEIDFTEFGIDYMISPEDLAAKEIQLLLEQSVFNDTVLFGNGSLHISGCVLKYDSPLINITIDESITKFKDIPFICIAIKRENSANTIIPTEKTVFRTGDQVYFSIPTKHLEVFYSLISKEPWPIKDIIILGGSLIGRKSAMHLCDQNFNVKILEKNQTKALEIAELIPNALVIKSDGRNVELLKDEDIEKMDAFVAVTGNSETNIMTCLLAKSKGVKKTIALVENMDYINITQDIGIDTFINKKLLAASAILKHVRKGEVLALASLNNLEAEILEFEVNSTSAISKKYIPEITLTKKAIFAGIIRDGIVHTRFSDFQIQPKDKVIVFCLPQAISQVEKLFNLPKI